MITLPTRTYFQRFLNEKCTIQVLFLQHIGNTHLIISGTRRGVSPMPGAINTVCPSYSKSERHQAQNLSEHQPATWPPYRMPHRDGRINTGDGCGLPSIKHFTSFHYTIATFREYSSEHQVKPQQQSDQSGRDLNVPGKTSSRHLSPLCFCNQRTNADSISE